MGRVGHDQHRLDAPLVEGARCRRGPAAPGRCRRRSRRCARWWRSRRAHRSRASRARSSGSALANELPGGAAARERPAPPGRPPTMLASTNASNRLHDSRPSTTPPPVRRRRPPPRGSARGSCGRRSARARAGPQRVEPGPQLRQPVLEVEHVGDQLPPGVGRELQPRRQHRRRELGHQRACPRRPAAPPAHDPATAPPPGPRCPRRADERTPPPPPTARPRRAAAAGATPRHAREDHSPRDPPAAPS